MAVDAGMRKLKIPQRFIPYMEKHRLYELFYDLGNKLAMSRPTDPLDFIKKCLVKLLWCRDRRIIVFIAPPFLDRIKLSQLLSVTTGCGILSRYLISSKPGNYFDPKALALNLATFINDSKQQEWILADFPDNEEEAKMLIKTGIIPTHVFLFTSSDAYESNFEKEKIYTIDSTSSNILEFHNSVYKLQELFKSSLKIVKFNGKSIEDLATTCSRLANIMPLRTFPKLFRLILIGPRGSRRRTLANLLNKLYKMVHVDVLQLINSARNMESDIGDAIQFYDSNEYNYPKPLVFDLLKTRLYQKDCLQQGYVITNFPWCLEDLVVLDSTDTPPNKVIFLDINGVCQERLNDRVVNMYTGYLHSEKSIQNDNLLKSQTLHHPDDDECKVAEEIKFYMQNVQAMIDYCGNTCSVIDASGPLKSVLQRVEAYLMSSFPIGNPRSWKLPYNNYFQTEKVIKQRLLTYPLSRTMVVPLIDSSDVLNRYTSLKNYDIDMNMSNYMTENELELISVSNYKETVEDIQDDFDKGTDEPNPMVIIPSASTDNISIKSVSTS